MLNRGGEISASLKLMVKFSGSIHACGVGTLAAYESSRIAACAGFACSRSAD